MRSMTKTIILGIAVAAVLVAGIIAFMPPVQVEADEPDVKASIKAKLKLEQDGDDVDVKVKAKGLASDADFTVRAYISTVTNCMRGGGNALAAFSGTSDEDGELKISGTISDVDVDDVGSVSIRITGSPGTNPPVVCFQDTTP